MALKKRRRRSDRHVPSCTVSSARTSLYSLCADATCSAQSSALLRAILPICFFYVLVAGGNTRVCSGQLIDVNKALSAPCLANLKSCKTEWYYSSTHRGPFLHRIELTCTLCISHLHSFSFSKPWERGSGVENTGIFLVLFL